MRCVYLVSWMKRRKRTTPFYCGCVPVYKLESSALTLAIRVTVPDLAIILAVLISRIT